MNKKALGLLLIPVLATTLLSGCVSLANKEFQNAMASLQPVEQELRRQACEISQGHHQCLSANAMTKDELALYLVDPAKPTLKQAQEICALQERRIELIQPLVVNSQLSPTYKQAYLRFLQDQTELYRHFARGNMTWGQLHKRTQQLDERFKDKKRNY